VQGYETSLLKISGKNGRTTTVSVDSFHLHHLCSYIMCSVRDERVCVSMPLDLAEGRIKPRILQMELKCHDLPETRSKRYQRLKHQ